MAEEARIISIQPNIMTPKRGEETAGLAELEGIAAPLGELALGVLPHLAALQTLRIFSVDIIIEGAEEIAGTMRLETTDEGEARAIIMGKLGGNALRGVPYTATWTGHFYRRANPDLPYIVAGDHVEVEKDQMIAWGFVDKNTQWPILSDRTGTVHFIAEHGDEVVNGETVLYHLEARK